MPGDYPRLLSELEARIGAARTRAVLAVNSELIKLYWEIGHEILDREHQAGWGTKIIDRVGCGPSSRLPGHDGSFAVKSPLHEELRRGVATGYRKR
jgi:hypothetical protein